MKALIVQQNAGGPMDEYEYDYMVQTIDRLAVQGDIDYLQLLIFDWRQDKQEIDRIKTAWSIGAFIGWAAAAILFCVMGWWNDQHGYPSEMLRIWIVIVIVAISVTARRCRYTKISNLYRNLINKATARIKQL